MLRNTTLNIFTIVFHLQNIQMKKKLAIYLMLFALTLCYTHIVCCEQNNAKLSEIRRLGITHAKHLTSIQFAFTTDIVGLGKDQGEFFISGNKFYSRLDPFRFDNQILPSESAYNGEKYQLLDLVEAGKGEYLSYSSSPILPTSTGTLDPLLLSYAWLFTSGEFPQWFTIRDDAIWNKAFADAEYLGEETVEGQLCDCVKMPGILPNTINTIYFARDLNFFPFKTVTNKVDGSYFGTVQLDDFIEKDVDGELLVVPTKLHFSQMVEGNETPGETTLSIETLRINEPIDDDLFTISPTRANRVIDLDHQKSLMSKMKNSHNHNLPQLGVRVIVICIGFFCIALSVFFVIKKQNLDR